MVITVVRTSSVLILCVFNMLVRCNMHTEGTRWAVFHQILLPQLHIPDEKRAGRTFQIASGSQQRTPQQHPCHHHNW